MKTITELTQIFIDFDTNSKFYAQGKNWEITIFKPYNIDENVLRYHFRLYGKMSNSLFSEYNNNLQLAADVYYYFDLKNNLLTRKADIRELSDNIYCLIDRQETIKNI